MKITKQYLKQIIKEQINLLKEVDPFSKVPDSPFMSKLGPDDETREISAAEREKRRKASIEKNPQYVKIQQLVFNKIVNQVRKAQKENTRKNRAAVRDILFDVSQTLTDVNDGKLE